MIVPPYIARALASWQAWRTKCRLYRSVPQMRLLDAQEREARARHKAVRPIQQQRQALMHDILRRATHG